MHLPLVVQMNLLEANCCEIKTQYHGTRLRLVAFLGFTNEFIFNLVFQSHQDRQIFGLRPNGIEYFQRWRLQNDIPFTSLFPDLWNFALKIKDLKGHDSFVMLIKDEATIERLAHATSSLARICKRNFPSAPISFTTTRWYYVWIQRKESTVVRDINKTLLETWK